MIKLENICQGLVFTIPKNDAMASRFDTNKFKIISIGKKTVECLVYRKDDTESEDIAIFDIEYVSGHGCIAEQQQIKNEAVNHPNHYAWLKQLCGIEPIDICRHLDFNCGSAIKYLLRKGKKEMNLSEREQRVQDLSKAIFYLKDEIKMLENQK